MGKTFLKFPLRNNLQVNLTNFPQNFRENKKQRKFEQLSHLKGARGDMTTKQHVVTGWSDETVKEKKHSRCQLKKPEQSVNLSSKLRVYFGPVV